MAVAYVQNIHSDVTWNPNLGSHYEGLHTHEQAEMNGFLTLSGENVP